MDDTILVRVLPSGGQPFDDDSGPEQKLLSIREAAYEVAAKRVEPVLSMPEFSPELPATGVSFAEAFKLYVAEHPKVVKNEYRLNIKSPFPIRTYLNPPIWQNLQHLKRLRTAAGFGGTRVRRTRGFVARSLYDDDYPVPTRAVRRPDDQEAIKALNRCIAEFIFCSALHEFLTRLSSGALKSIGVSESDLETLLHKDIPAGWWSRNVIIHVNEGELLEQTEPKAGSGTRRWSNIRVMPGNARALEAALPNQDVALSRKPGRPKIIEFILLEFERRIRERRINKEGLRAEARALGAWQKENHPHALQAALGTIENAIRDRYREVGKRADP